MKNRNKIIYLLSVIFLTGCHKSSIEEGDIITEKIEEFPISLDLTKQASLDHRIPSMGIMEIRVVDSLLIASVNEHHKFWHLYSLPDLELMDSVLDIGSGPGEFDMPVPATYISILEKKEGKKSIAIPHISNYKMVIMQEGYNEAGRTLITDTIINLPIENNSFIYYMLDKERLLNFFIKPEEGKILRELINIREGLKYDLEIPMINYLNSRNVEDMSELSMILTGHIIKPGGTKVVEVSGYLNEIYLYDLTTGSSKKIIYPELKNLRDRNLKDKENMRNIFITGFGYNNFFTNIRYGVAEKGNERANLDFIDWEGKPMGTIELPNYGMMRCDISIDDGLLFCHVSENDEVVIYDISEFLKKIESLVSK